MLATVRTRCSLLQRFSPVLICIAVCKEFRPSGVITFLGGASSTR